MCGLIFPKEMQKGLDDTVTLQISQFLKSQRPICGMGETFSTWPSALLTYMVKLEMKAAAGICISNTPSRASDPLFTIVHKTVVKAYREMIVDFTENSDIRGLVSCRYQKVIY